MDLGTLPRTSSDTRGSTSSRWRFGRCNCRTNYMTGHMVIDQILAVSCQCHIQSLLLQVVKPPFRSLLVAQSAISKAICVCCHQDPGCRGPPSSLRMKHVKFVLMTSLHQTCHEYKLDMFHPKRIVQKYDTKAKLPGTADSKV